MKVLKLLLPNGHLCPRVAGLLLEAGYEIFEYGPDKRIYKPGINVEYFDITVRRPLQIAIELARGEADVGILGKDSVSEFAGAELLLDLERPETRLVLAIRDETKFSHIRDIESFLRHVCPKGVTIYAEYPGFVRECIFEHPAYKSRYKDAPGLDLGWQIIRSSSPIIIRMSLGATEANLFFADSVETGHTIKKNGSRIIHTLLDRSSPWLAASSYALSYPWKRAKIMEFRSRLKTALAKHSETGALRGNLK